MSIYRLKLTSESIKTLVISLDLDSSLVPNFAIIVVREGLLADHKGMPGNHIADASTKNKIKNGKSFMKNRCMILRNHTRIICVFLVSIQGSY